MRHILLITILLLFPWGVQAQKVNLGLAPLEHEIIAKPGATISLPYTLTNYGDATLVTVAVVRLEIADSLGNYTLLPLTENDTPEPQLTITELTKEPFLLLAKEQYTGSLIVEIPQETKEKDYYYALVTRSQNSQGFETSTAVKIQGGVAAPIFISVSKTGNTEHVLSAPLVELHRRYNSFLATGSTLLLDTKNPVSGSIVVENKGRNLTKMTGTVTVTSSFSLLPYHGFKADIPPMTMLAGSRKSLRLPEIKALPMGRYTLRTTVTNGTETVSSNVSFISFPFTLTSYLIGIALLVGIGFFGYKRYTNT